MARLPRTQYHPVLRRTISEKGPEEGHGIGGLMDPRDLDSWHSERALEREAAPVRHAVAAWLMAALLVIVGVFGRPATSEVAHGIGELRQEARVLDHRLGDLSAQLVVQTANAANRLVPFRPAAAGRS
jgi:hypothetical protein